MAIACRSRFARPAFLWSFTALITQLAVKEFLKRGYGSSYARWLALLPVLPMMLFIAALVRAFFKMDELQKRIWLESLAIAFALSLFLALIFGGLKSAGIY